MKRKRLFWQLFPSYIFLTLLSLAVVVWITANIYRTLSIKRSEKELHALAQLAAMYYTGPISKGNLQEIKEISSGVGRAGGVRVTVIQPGGHVLWDTQDKGKRKANDANQPEVAKALRGIGSTASRHSGTLKKTMLYAAHPVRRDGRIRGVVRVAQPSEPANRAFLSNVSRIAVWASLVFLTTAATSLLVSRRLGRMLQDIQNGAERYARGDLERSITPPGIIELGSLSEAMNEMASQLVTRLRAIVRQRNELEALLAAMIEGVLAVDMDLQIFKTNAAAEQLLGIPPGAAQGHDILELVRNPELHDLIHRTIESEQPVEGEIILYGKDKRVLQIHGTALPDAHGRIAGAVIVLNDITRIKDLENVRRDFVANVSHELKTPITSIKGFVETLQDGAMDSPEEAARFLDIIAHHSERLNAIIDDLLSLSRIERLDDKDLLNAEPGLVRDILESAILNCTEKAGENNIAIELECPVELSARMNPRLLEQAVANLIDNAIKYSEPETTVNVEAHTEGDDVVIHVRDHGRGISREHLPRLFERFYRVDKARSRTLGGTGLGLAIVKHIAMAHGGFASVTSTPGKGSDFIIKFPAK